MAVINSRAVVNTVEMYGVTAIRLPSTLGTNLNQLIKSLFSNGEQGFAYDPNDLSTMFQDAAGTVPVTGAGQPVGLILDESKRLVLGVEKLSNNDFSNNGVGWVIAGGVPTYAGGVVTLTTQAGGTGEIYQDISVPVGRLVKITARAKYSNALSFGLNVYDGGGYTNHKGVIVFGTSFEEKSGYFFSTTGSLRVRMRLATSTTTGTCDVDYISVKEIAGNHASQTTSASRPILQQTPILGNELVAGGGFSNGTVYPFEDFTTSNGGFSGKTTTAKIGGAVSNTALNVTAGVTYVIAFDLIYSLDGRALSVRLVNNTSGAGSGGNSGISTSKLGKNIINYTPSVSGSFYLQFNNGGPFISDYRVENISMKEVLGYRTDQNYIKYDGVDDKLITALPVQLTGCTVIRSVPNVSTQILTGQTIPTPYNDNTDHCGLIVINRALTASETSAITAEFNKRAGV